MKAVAVITAVLGIFFLLDCLFESGVCSGLIAVALFVYSMGIGIINEIKNLKS
jgi:hypothetical protein